MNDRARTVPFETLLVVSLGIVLPACTTSDSGAEWKGAVTDSAGIRVVHNPAEGMWRPGEEWRVTEAMTIGSDSMGAAYQFGTINGIALGPDGEIVVLDAQAGEIRVFDRLGTHLRTIGRRGAGPGEFSRAAAGAFVTADGQLGVPDMGNSRLNWLDLDGEFLGSVPLSYSNGFPVRWDADGTGEIVVQRRAMGMNQDPDLAAGDPLVRIGRDGEERQLVLMPLAKTVRMIGSRPQFTYFETEPSWDLGPSGMLRTAMTQEYRIEVRGRDGTLQSIVTRETPRREVTAADRDHFEALMREALTRRGTAPDAVQRFMARLEYGTTFPAFNQLMEGPDGTMVVQRVQIMSEMTSIDLSEEQSRRLGSSRWDIFDAGGRYLGVLDLPARFTPMVWESSAVYGRWLDDVDRQYVKQLNLVRPD